MGPVISHTIIMVQTAMINAAELPVAAVAQFANFSNKFFLLFGHGANIYTLQPKKNRQCSYTRRFLVPIRYTAYNLLFASMQFKSPKATVKRFTKFLLPLRNHTRGS
jgi:hypothetical protein